MREIKGALYLAAAIYVDAGILAVNKMVATLRAILKNPALALERAIEPGALGELARHYQRVEESVGTHFYDLTGDGSNDFRQTPEHVAIQAAAYRAITVLQTEVASGRSPAHVEQILAQRLGQVFLRFNPSIGRESILIGIGTHIDGKELAVQAEAGPFLEFLEMVLEPLNSYLNSLPAPLSRRWVSAGGVARIATKPANLTRLFNKKG